jgi:hypothetical protein
LSYIWLRYINLRLDLVKLGNFKVEFGPLRAVCLVPYCLSLDIPWHLVEAVMLLYCILLYISEVYCGGAFSTPGCCV